LRVGKEQPGSRMFEDVRRMIERLRWIDRYDDAPREKRREIASDPINRVVPDQRNAVAGDETRVADRARDVFDSLQQSFARRRRPRPADALDEYFVARLCEHAPNQVR
jgi:hypothetical protein